MLGIWPYWNPSRTDLKSSPASRGSWRMRRKSGLIGLRLYLVKSCLYLHSLLLTEYLLDIPAPGFVIEDSYRNPVFRVGCDGEVPELTLLHPHVPVSVDLLTAEPFLPGL